MVDNFIFILFYKIECDSYITNFDLDKLRLSLIKLMVFKKYSLNKKAENSEDKSK